jgi:flagellar biosynthesis/type III secretory pathway chaperone
MNELLSNRIDALREELTQYGEMLARLDHQQTLVMRRQTDDLSRSVSDIHAQAEVIAASRSERERHQGLLIQRLALPAAATYGEIVPLLPADYRPLVQALVAENNELLVRVRQRARQNHLLLSHAVEHMQRLINVIFPGSSPKTYDGNGQVPGSGFPQHSLYEAVG